MNRIFLYLRKPVPAILVLGLLVLILGLLIIPHAAATRFDRSAPDTATSTLDALFNTEPEKPVFDKDAYDAKMLSMANYASSTPTTTPRIWPVKDAPYPKEGALLPFNRIIAYYGNFYSTRMGVLGEYDEATMLSMLRAEQDRWEAADPETPTVPAINYIAITAQPQPGRENRYMLRMPDTEIDKALAIAEKVDGIVILDIQIGHSTLQYELPLLEKYLAMPNVHLGLDPEFHMPNGDVPGDVIGSFNAGDINFAAEYMAELVREHDLPPKVLIVHRFTRNMVKNYQDITPLPEVQIVMDMDGWGPPTLKLGTYQQFIVPEPVQFTGFKIFYKNDMKPPSTRLLTPADLLELTPQPMFIQYQ